MFLLVVCGKEGDVSDLAYIAGNTFGIIEDVIEGLVRKGGTNLAMTSVTPVCTLADLTAR